MSLMAGYFVMFAATWQEGNNYFESNVDHLQLIKKNISPGISYINVLGAVFRMES